MGGGPNASIIMCSHCTGKANRISEGLEVDRYLCEKCGAGFMVSWDGCIPEKPCWPPCKEELEEARRILQKMGKLTETETKDN